MMVEPVSHDARVFTMALRNDGGGSFQTALQIYGTSLENGVMDGFCRCSLYWFLVAELRCASPHKTEMARASRMA